MATNQKVGGSNPFSRTKKKDTLRRVFLFGFRRPEGRLHPVDFKCSGTAEPPLRQGFRSGENTCTPQKRRGPEGPLGCSPIPFRNFKLSILTNPSSSSQVSYRLRRAFSFHDEAHRALILLLSLRLSGRLAPKRTCRRSRFQTATAVLGCGLGPPFRGGFVPFQKYRFYLSPSARSKRHVLIASILLRQ